MTCIVGLIDNGTVYMGGDSAASNSNLLLTVTNPKVFKNGPFLIGYTTSFRMGQLLQYKFIPPAKKENQTDISYMVTDFIDAIKKCFINNDFGKKEDNLSILGGSFLVGYNGKLYIIEDDFCVLLQKNNFSSVGAGYLTALGSLYSTEGMNPLDRIKIALNASNAFVPSVSPPYMIISEDSSMSDITII